MAMMAGAPSAFEGTGAEEGGDQGEGPSGSGSGLGAGAGVGGDSGVQ